MRVCACMCVFEFFSEITEPTEPIFPAHVPRDRGGKFIQMRSIVVHFNICSAAPRGPGLQITGA